MSFGIVGRRALAVLGLSLALCASLERPATALPRQDPAHCIGQPEIRPLQPLQLMTSKGVTRFMVEVAVTPDQLEYGLMCRKALAPDRGMLFEFARTDELEFWMRNTLIALDIVYIGADGRVVSIARDARPLDETPLPSHGDARGVLELPAGRAAQLDLKPGDRVTHPFFPAN